MPKPTNDAGARAEPPTISWQAGEHAGQANRRFSQFKRHRAHARAARTRRSRIRLVRRVLAGACVALLGTAGWSYYSAMSAPGTDPWTARSVEWLRDNGMNGVVNAAERWWYTSHPPPVGGTPKHGLPRSRRPSGAAVAKHAKPAVTPNVVPHLTPPPNMVPLVASPLAGEGMWQPTGRTVAGLPAVYTAFFRPDAVHTSLVAAAMWMDTKLLSTAYVVGLVEPGGPPTWGAQVPPPFRGGLVAAFNSGFKITAARGGVYTDGRMIQPLVDGAASLVIDRGGTANVGVWGRDFTMSPDVATVRQNLALIVDNGQPVDGLPSNVNGAWGATLGNKVLVSRSGVGVDANGGLIYVAGPGLSAMTLAILLQRAGCVRAMELDINDAWVTAYTYQQVDPTNPTAVQGVKLLPEMHRSNDRYLVPGERDFFALFSRH